MGVGGIRLSFGGLEEFFGSVWDYCEFLQECEILLLRNRVWIRLRGGGIGQKWVGLVKIIIWVQVGLTRAPLKYRQSFEKSSFVKYNLPEYIVSLLRICNKIINLIINTTTLSGL